MKKITLVLLILGLLISGITNAQEAKKDTSYWKKTTQMGLTFSNSGYINWVPGSQTSTALNLFFNTKGEYNKDVWSWVNDFQSQFGFIANESGLRKSFDRIFFDSKVGRKLSDKWLLVGDLNFQSQFANGFKYGQDKSGINTQTLISGLFAPAYITEAIGLEWKPKPYFNMVFSPLTMRQTIVANKDVFLADTTGKILPAYGVAPGNTIKNEVGLLQIVSTFDKDIMTNVNLKLRHQMFISYDNIPAIYNRLDAKVAAKINKYLSATVDFIILYDQTQSYHIQELHNFGIGFLYTL